MRLTILAVLLLSACSGPSEYRFPPAHPTPVYTPPGTGLPMPSAPGPGMRNVPRSPHRRTLPPPGNQPGLWSADAPKASGTSDDDYDETPVQLLGVDLPTIRTSALAMTWAKACASTVGEVLGDPKMFKRLDALSGPESACVSAVLYARCMDNVLRYAKTSTTQGRNTLTDLHRKAQEFSKKICHGALKSGAKTATDVVTDAGQVVDDVADKYFGGIQ